MNKTPEQKLAEAEKTIEFLKARLEDIVNPVRAIERSAKETGCSVDYRMAMQLSNDPVFIKDIAARALRAVGKEI